MPTFTGQSPATAADAVSIQNVAGTLAQKSESLNGPIVTSDFTTTSASLVDVTGMTITLAATNNVTTKLRAMILYDGAAVASTATFSLSSSATKEYTWLGEPVAATTAWVIARNGDIALNANAVSTILLPVLLNGQVSGTTSGVVVKIQASITNANTLTIKVGSVLYGDF